VPDEPVLSAVRTLLKAAAATLVAAAAVVGVPAQVPVQAGSPASTSASGGPATPPAVGAVAPIPIYAIPRAAEPLLAQFESLSKQAAVPPLVTEVGEALPAVESALAALDRRRTTHPLAEASRGNLTDWRLEYMRNDDRLAALETRLEKRASEFEDRLSEIGAQAELWTLSRDHAATEEAPETILNRIDEVLAKLAAAGRMVRERRTQVLALLVEVSSRRILVAGAVRDLDGALKTEDERLFQAESSNLWTALENPPHRFGLGGELLDAWSDNGHAFRRFAEESTGRLIIHVGVFAALLALLLALRPGITRRASEDESLAVATRVLARPASAALLIALILTFWIHPLAPRSVYRVVTLLMVIPLMCLVPQLVAARLYGPLKVLAALYLFDRIIAFASPHSLLLRLLVLAVTIAATVLLAWDMRPAGGLGGWTGRRRLVVRFASWTALALLTVSVLCNVFGNVTLADLLCRGVLISAYAGIAFYAAARILESLWAALLGTHAARRSRLVARHEGILRERGVRIIGAVALLVWLGAALRVFGLFSPARDGLAAWLRTPRTFGDVTVSPGDIALFVVTLGVSIILARFLRFVLDEGVLPAVRLPRGVPAAISMTAQYVVAGAGLVLAVSASGMTMDRFTFLAGAIGVGVGFGLQNVVNNFVSGLILLYERPVQKGDIVEVGPLLGEVRRIGVRSSTVHTYDGAEVIVPNATLIAQEVVNWTLSDRRRRVEIKVGVAYGTDPARVLDLLVGVVRGRPGVEQTPAPAALFDGFGDSSLDFLLRFWTPEIDSWVQVRSDVRTAIHAALNDAGIEIPFPQRDLHLRSVDPEAAQVLTQPAAGPGPA
jgi:small-conductance mechanosensitive channel